MTRQRATPPAATGKKKSLVLLPPKREGEFPRRPLSGNLVNRGEPLPCGSKLLD